MVIGFLNGGISYIRDGVRCYLSETLRHEPWITDGELRVESKEWGSQCLYISIDFKRELIRFKDPDEAYSGCLSN